MNAFKYAVAAVGTTLAAVAISAPAIAQADEGSKVNPLEPLQCVSVVSGAPAHLLLCPIPAESK